MAAIHITKQDCINRIWDYETNRGEWAFKGDRPAIVDFFAQWCGPCKMLSPVLDGQPQMAQGALPKSTLKDIIEKEQLK